eukprot:TRINITY_DN1501_c0_g1_i1.p1 TRINITY_DN1501_c0_g1~~TRINITY_DN1501_c0_g1_i1.p1  ORF type:complete len:132 (+),score=48.89 TRINITY_DN1501_c0_g1_i1:117-512(+)
MSEEQQDFSLLLDDNLELTDALTDALKTIFKNFDKDNDGVWNINELQSYALFCNNGEEFSQDEVDQISMLDTNDNGELTELGFLQMYHLQTSAEPNETISDLKIHGYKIIDNKITYVGLEGNNDSNNNNNK